MRSWERNIFCEGKGELDVVGIRSGTKPACYGSGETERESSVCAPLPKTWSLSFLAKGIFEHPQQHTQGWIPWISSIGFTCSAQAKELLGKVEGKKGFKKGFSSCFLEEWLVWPATEPLHRCAYIDAHAFIQMLKLSSSSGWVTERRNKQPSLIIFKLLKQWVASLNQTGFLSIE